MLPITTSIKSYVMVSAIIDMRTTITLTHELQAKEDEACELRRCELVEAVYIKGSLPRQEHTSL